MFTRSIWKTKDMIEQHDLLNHMAKLVNAGKVRTTPNERLGTINASNLQKAHAASLTSCSGEASPYCARRLALERSMSACHVQADELRCQTEPSLLTMALTFDRSKSRQSARMVLELPATQYLRPPAPLFDTRNDR